MHSGNVGHAQDLETLIHAPTHVRELDDLELVLIGSGAMGAALSDLAKRLELRSVRFSPISHASALRSRCPARTSTSWVWPPDSPVTSFRAASTEFSQWDGPSSLHADEDSETAQIVQTHGCGMVDRRRADPELLAQAIRDAYDGRFDLAEMGASRACVRGGGREP